MKRIALFLFMMLILCSVEPGPVQSQQPLPEWVSIVPAEDCSQGCWRFVPEESYYLPQEQSGGLHHAFARTKDANGNYIVAPFTLGWSNGSAVANTKTPPDWGDHPLWSCFFPDQNQTGGYRVWGGIWESNSDVVRGIGLPYCHHVTYWLVWRWEPPGGATPTPTATVTMTPTATATPTVCVECRRLWLPLVAKR